MWSIVFPLELIGSGLNEKGELPPFRNDGHICIDAAQSQRYI
jgi:hypothetical protein